MHVLKKYIYLPKITNFILRLRTANLITGKGEEQGSLVTFRLLERAIESPQSSSALLYTAGSTHNSRKHQTPIPRNTKHQF